MTKAERGRKIKELKAGANGYRDKASALIKRALEMETQAAELACPFQVGDRVFREEFRSSTSVGGDRKIKIRGVVEKIAPGQVGYPFLVHVRHLKKDGTKGLRVEKNFWSSLEWRKDEEA